MEIYLILFTLILSAFFSGIEIAYVSVNKLKVELMKQQGSVSGRLLGLVTNSPSHFLGAMLIGNNIALIVLSIMMAKTLEPVIEYYLPISLNTELSVLLIQTFITTILVLIFGEFLPKVIFRIHPDAVLRFFSFPIAFAYYLLYPLVQFIIYITHLLLKIFFKVNYSQNQPVFSHVDLEHFINQFVKSPEEEEEINAEIFERALYLKEVRARECMVPRTEIEALDVNATLDELRVKFAETRLSRIIIYDENIDSILGYVHHFDLLKIPGSIREILFPIKVIPESMFAKDILNLFMKDHKSICWVVDEFGGTAGIVTMEDVLEEIFGEIKDEHDTEEFLEKQIYEDEYIFSGRLEIDFLNEKYNLNIPEGEYETLAGYILSNHENIPEKGEEIFVDRFKFKILNVGETRIELVRIKILPKIHIGE